MASAALAAELSALKMGALSRRAVEAGVDADALEAAQDEGDRAAIIALIVAREVDPVEELRAELRTLKLGALSKRAVAAGVEGDALEAAQDDGDKAAIIELIAARTAAIPEGVPSEPVNLHTVGLGAAAHANAIEPECEPGRALGRPPPAKRAPPQAVHRGLPSSHRAFGSMRFDGVVPAHAEQLQAAMRSEGADLEIINMTGGGDIDRAVQEGIKACDAFIIFGSAKYGEDTGNMACTYYESKFAWDQKKRIILIRMIPFGQQYEFDQAQFLFGLNLLVLPWMLGAPMPAELPGQILEAMGLAGGVAAAAAAAAPCSPQPAVAAAPSITTVAELAAAARCTEPEVLALAEGELTELLLELQVGLALRVGPRSRSGCECSALTAPAPRCWLRRWASSAASASSRTCGPSGRRRRPRRGDGRKPRPRRPGRCNWRRPTTPTREASASCWWCREQTRSWPSPPASAWWR
jgi:hypothetical protein